MIHLDLITSPEAAALLCRSSRTVHRLVQSNALTPYRRFSIGPHGAYLFHRADVLALIEARA